MQPGVLRAGFRQFGVGLFLCGAVLFGFSAGATAQYIETPGVLNGPIPAAPAPTPTGTEPTLLAPAPAWSFTPSLTIRETYTDNVDLAPPGQEHTDLITTIAPGLNIVGQTAHVNLVFTYDPQVLLFALGNSSPLLRQQLLGTTKIELYPQEVFFDGSASISQGYVSTAGAIAPTTLTTNKNLQTVEAVNASPYILHHLGSYVDTESRYRFSTVSTGATGIGTQTTNELTSFIKSGDYFAPLKWQLTSDYQLISGLTAPRGAPGAASRTDGREELNVEYPVWNRVSVTSTIGWEQIKDPTLVRQPRGLIWDIGLRYDPSPFASISVAYGHRPTGTDFSFSARYDVGAQTHLAASYSQSIQTTQSLIAANLNGLIVGPGGVLIDPKTGLPVTPGNPPFGPGVVPFSLTNGSFLDKRFELDATATRGRNTFALTAYDDRQSEQVAQSNTNALGATVSWNRQLWPNLTSNVALSYARIGFDGSGRTDNYYSVDASLAYTLSRTTNAQLSFTRSNRESNQKQSSLVDDLVTLSVRKLF